MRHKLKNWQLTVSSMYLVTCKYSGYVTEPNFTSSIIELACPVNCKAFAVFLVAGIPVITTA